MRNALVSYTKQGNYFTSSNSVSPGPILVKPLYFKHKLANTNYCEIIFQNKINYRYEVYVYSNSYNKHTCEMSYAVLDLLENFAFLCACNSTCSNTFLGCWVFSKYIFPKFLTDTSKMKKKFTQINFLGSIYITELGVLKLLVIPFKPCHCGML